MKPRRTSPLTANSCATRASRPMPAMLKNRWPSSSPASMGRGWAASASAIARFGRRSTPSSRARPFPDPAGIIPSGTSPKTSADATSLMVPSPPHAITSRTPLFTAAFASSRAWPGRWVTNTSAGSPWASTTVAASCARARMAAGLAPLEMGLMMMATAMSDAGPSMSTRFYFIARRRALLSVRSVSSTTSTEILFTR